MHKIVSRHSKISTKTHQERKTVSAELDVTVSWKRLTDHFTITPLFAYDHHIYQVGTVFIIIEIIFRTCERL